jgi:hypothetical protein
MREFRKRQRVRPVSAPGQVEHTQVTRALARGGLALLANSGLTAALGVAFWLVAARILTTTAVGRGSALISALWTVSGLCQLNYARSLSGLIPSATRPRRLLASVYGLTAALSFAGGIVTAFALPRAAAGFGYLRGNMLFTASFVGAVVLWTIFSLEDAALTSVRRATIIPFENGMYGVLKLACLFALWRFGYKTGLTLFISWIIPLTVIVIPVNLFLFLRAVPMSVSPPRQRVSHAQPWVRYDFAGYLLWLAGTLPLPLLVTISVGASTAASFYVPFSIASSIDLLSLNLGNTLTAELSRAHGVMTPAIRSHMRRIWIAVGALSVTLCVMAPEMLQVFGDKYRIGGTVILRIFMIAALPRSVLFLGIAVHRSRNQGRAILLLQAISSLGTLALGLALARPFGATGIALGWLAASCLAALMALLLMDDRIRRRLRHTGTRARTPESHRTGILGRADAQRDDIFPILIPIRPESW